GLDQRTTQGREKGEQPGTTRSLSCLNEFDRLRAVEAAWVSALVASSETASLASSIESVVKPNWHMVTATRERAWEAALGSPGSWKAQAPPAGMSAGAPVSIDRSCSALSA
ncbi:hypothetical protein ABTW95_35160, partial [Spirillospora sp. NPDC127506]